MHAPVRRPTAGRLEFKVLGSWMVSADGGVVTVPAGQQRTLLASLLLAAGQPVRFDTLTAQLWDERLPVHARGSLSTYVTRLRKLLGEDAIATCAGSGYRLCVDGDQVDLYRFRELVRRSRSAAGAEEELELLRQALGQWRGRPFDGVESAWLERDVLPTLLDEWLVAAERRIDLELACGAGPAGGDLGGLIAELWELTNRYPLRESLWCRLILALHRAGRRADALQAYQRVSRALREELGIDPGAELQRLERTVLDAPAQVGATTAPGACQPPAEPQLAPRQLPPDNAAFGGRAEALASLDALVGPHPTGPDTGNAAATATGRLTLVVAIDGAPGTGKTTLAVHWAHRVAHRYPDAHLYLNLRGYSAGEPVQPAAAAETLLRGLGVAGARIPADLDERAALLRSTLAGRRTLLLLDNARDAEQVRPLIPGSDSLVIVTSRNQLRALSIRDGAHRVTLGRLDHDEAVAMLRAAVGPDRVDAESRAAGQLAELCDRLPLALAIVAERAQRAAGLGDVVHGLADEKARLDALGSGGDDGYSDVRGALSWSYRALDPAAAGMFRRLGQHPAGDIGLPAVAVLADLPLPAAKRALDRLVEAHLVEQRRPDRYELHDLIRLYAADQARAHEDAAGNRAAARRLLDWYLYAAVSADTVLMPLRRRDFLVPYPPPPARLDFADQGQALAWFEQEYDCLRTVVAWAAANGWAGHAWRTVIAMTTFQDRRIPWREGVEFLTAARDVARSVADRAGEGYTLNSLGCIYWDQRDWDRAKACFRQALACFRDTANPVGEAMALGNLGLAHASTGEPADGQWLAEEALRLCEAAGYRRGVAQNLDNLGVAHTAAGDHGRAVECHRRAAAILAELGEEEVGAWNEQDLGRAYAAAGRYADSVRSFRHAARTLHRLGNRRQEAAVLVDLGGALRDAGHPGLARGCWQAALVIMRELADPRVPEVAAAIVATP